MKTSNRTGVANQSHNWPRAIRSNIPYYEELKKYFENMPIDDNQPGLDFTFDCFVVRTWYYASFVELHARDSLSVSFKSSYMTLSSKPVSMETISISKNLKRT